MPSYLRVCDERVVTGLRSPLVADEPLDLIVNKRTLQILLWAANSSLLIKKKDF